MNEVEIKKEGMQLIIGSKKAELIVTNKEKAIKVFSSKKELSKLVEIIKKSIKQDMPADLSKKTNRDFIISQAASIPRAKVQISKYGKELTLSWREKTKLVNDNIKEMVIEMDKFRDSTRKPVTEWENTEKSRILAHNSIIEKLKSYRNSFDEKGNKYSVKDLNERKKKLENFEIDSSLEEFELDGYNGKKTSLIVISKLIEDEQKAADLALEVKNLKRKEAIRVKEEKAKAKKEHENEMIKRAVKKERIIADKRQMEIEKEKKAVENKKKIKELKEKEEAEQIIIKLKTDKLKAEERVKKILAKKKSDEKIRAKKQADEKARAKEQAERAKEQAERAKEQAERNKIEAVRIEKARAKEQAERAKEQAECEKKQREADVNHGVKIRGEAKRGLINAGLTEEVAIKVVLAIANKKVPNLSINY